MSNDVLTSLKILIDSSTPIIVMETVEEMRAVQLVRAAASSLQLPVFEWTIASGLVRSGSLATPPTPPGKPALGHPADTRTAEAAAAPAIYNSREPVQALATLDSVSLAAVFILKDFHRHLDDPVVVRRLRDVGQQFSVNRRTIVITAPQITVPPELSSLVEHVELPLPDSQRLGEIINEVFHCLSETRTLRRTLDEAGCKRVAENLRGLTEEEADRAVAHALVTRYGLTEETVTDVLAAKKDLLRNSGMLEFIEASDDMASLGGLDNLKHWLRQRRGAWEESAREFGLEPARGVVILGVQGCGKSLCARAIAGEWKLPLVKFDAAAVFDKYIGETEKRIERVFGVAEGLAPCVLWIDELEKIFAGSGPGSASVDAGVSSRILAAFLSWMQDRTAPVFVAATSNDVTALPPELIRKGRFDELFFVDLPNASERREIFSIQLSKRKRKAEDFDLERLAACARGFSGAEIEAGVQSALFAAYSEQRQLTTEILIEVLGKSVPLSTTLAEEIQSLRSWAKQRAVGASRPDAMCESA